MQETAKKLISKRCCQVPALVRITLVRIKSQSQLREPKVSLFI